MNRAWTWLESKLVWNWRDVLRKAWSMRWMAAAAIFSAIEVGLPFFSESIPRGIFAVLSMVAVSAAFVFRLIAQKGLSE